MGHYCKYAYRKNGDVSLHCRCLTEKGERHDWCAHQYLCARTKKWEVSDGEAHCKIKT